MNNNGHKNSIHVIYSEQCCGTCTWIPDIGLGHGLNEVMEVIKQTGLESGHHAVFDNLFTLLPFLETLPDQGIGATGTLHKDGFCGASLMPKKSIEKNNHCYTEEAFTGCISVVKWKEHKVVCVASNKFRQPTIHKAKSWSIGERKHTEINMPYSVWI